MLRIVILNVPNIFQTLLLKGKIDKILVKIVRQKFAWSLKYCTNFYFRRKCVSQEICVAQEEMRSPEDQFTLEHV